MIKVTKKDKPQILIDHEKIWAKELDDFILANGGSFENVPKNKQHERDALANRYNHKELRSQLEKGNTGNKCVYCEKYLDTNDVGIEHFHPKVIYHKETFDWDNLFLSCASCNSKKSTLDTKNEMIVHPSNHNPEEYFIFKDVRIQSSPYAPDITIANRTIEKCALNRRHLFSPMSSILSEFYTYEDAVKDKVSAYNQGKKKVHYANKLLASLRELKSGFFDSETDTKAFVGYMRYLIRNSESISESITIINKHKAKLGLTDDFVF